MFSDKEIVFLNGELNKFTGKIEERLSSAQISDEQRIKLEEMLVTASSVKRKIEWERRSKSQKRQETPHILIIDDSASALQLNKQFLMQVGFKKVEVASDGAEGLKKMKGAATIKKPFGLVVCDWEMPKMSGLDLLQEVRKDSELWATPFYLLSSRSQRSDIVKAINIGATGYITKPISQAILDEKLKSYIVN